MKKYIITSLILFVVMSVSAQTGASAYICDNSGTPTNVRNAPNGKIVKKLPDIDGGYVVSLLEVRNKWWRIDPVIDVYGGEENEYVQLNGSKTGYWVHYSVLQFGIAGDHENVLRETPSPKGKPLKVAPSYLHEVGLCPLEIRGEWIKVITSDNRYTGWMPIDKICDNPLTTCP
jgi:hypothetical protein